MIKVLLVGVGGMGGCHLGEYRKLKDSCTLAAVADVETEKTKEKVKEDGIKVYYDYKEAIEKEQPDVVDICTPSYMHADMAVYALSHGCNVLCEKPMALNSEDCKRMKQCAEENNKLLMTAHVVRFMSPYVYLREQIQSGKMGALKELSLQRVCENPNWSWENWMLDREKSGCALFDLVVHDIDYVQSIFKSPKHINAVYNKRKSDKDSDIVHIQLAYDGFTACISGGHYGANIPFQVNYFAVFENGYIRFDGNDIYKNGVKAEQQKSNQTEDTGINIKNADGYFEEIRAFINCVKEKNADVPVLPQSSIDTILLTEEIYKQAKM